MLMIQFYLHTDVPKNKVLELTYKESKYINQ